MAWTVTSMVASGLLAEASAAYPHECCGLLLGTGSAISAYRPAANVDPAPETRFEIDPQTLIDAHRAMRQGGPRVLGYYHSHPSGPPEPSATDRAQAAGDGLVWAIVGEGRIGLWLPAGDAMTPLPYRLLDG